MIHVNEYKSFDLSEDKDRGPMHATGVHGTIKNVKYLKIVDMDIVQDICSEVMANSTTKLDDYRNRADYYGQRPSYQPSLSLVSVNFGRQLEVTSFKGLKYDGGNIKGHVDKSFEWAYLYMTIGFMFPLPMNPLRHELIEDALSTIKYMEWVKINTDEGIVVSSVLSRSNNVEEELKNLIYKHKVEHTHE